MTYRSLFFFIFFASLIKVLALFLTNFDLFGDEAQYWIWSQKFEFGYYSKPPLLSWIIKIFTLILGNSFQALKAVPFVFYFFTACVIYFLSLELFKNKKLAVISGLSFYLLPSVSVSSFLLSTDVILLFFWSLSLLYLLKVRKEQNIINFIFLGIFLGLSFLAKYAAIYFFISLIILLCSDIKIRKSFLKNIFFSTIFLLSFFATLLPNIIWNIKNNWVTLFHTSENAGFERVSFNLTNGLEFLLTQSLMVGPILFFSLFYFFKKIKFDFTTLFLLVFSIPIFLIVFIESIIVRANANWAAVALVSLFLYLVNHVYVNSKNILFLNNLLNFLFCVVFFVLIMTSQPLKIFDRINGISDFTTKLEKENIKKIKYLVVSDRLLFSSIKHKLRNTDILMFTPHKPKSAIKSHFQISSPLPYNFNETFIYLGRVEEIDYLDKKKSIIKMRSASVPFKKEKIDIYEVSF